MPEVDALTVDKLYRLVIHRNFHMPVGNILKAVGKSVGLDIEHPDAGTEPMRYTASYQHPASIFDTIASTQGWDWRPSTDKPGLIVFTKKA